MRGARPHARKALVAARAGLRHTGAPGRGRHRGAAGAEGGAERGARGGIQVQVREARRRAGGYLEVIRS